MDNTQCISVDSDAKFESTFVLQLCESINTPRALTVYLLIKNNMYSEYLNLTIDSSAYEDISNFADDYLVTKILSKSPNLPLDIDRKAVALESTMDSEAQCKHTNDLIYSGLLDSNPTVFRVKKHIDKLLGPMNSEVLNDIESLFKHGSGATTGVRGHGSSSSDKFDETIHLTERLLPFYKSIMGENWISSNSSIQVVKGNIFSTVPKSAKTDRPICIEPTLNMYGQLGIGTYLKSRLARFSIDLRDQSRNRALARRAYSDDLATIDLAAASDSISAALVLLLIPQDWFDLLYLFRCDYSFINGEWKELEKFSSMGNGYTFELESLIFGAVVRSIVPKHRANDCGVYGDDLIVPKAYAQDVIDALELLGFRVNTQKSFLAGAFYESCGADFFKGSPVRPFYLRKEKGNKIPYSLQVANALRLYLSNRSDGYGCDKTFKDIWVSLLKLIPKPFRSCRIPSSFGDTGVICSFNELSHLPKRANHSIEGFMVRHVDFPPVRRVCYTQGVLLSGLARMDLMGSDRTPLKTLSSTFITNTFLTPARLRAVDFALNASGRNTEIATKGREPRRGYLGKVKERSSLCIHWDDGLSWY